MRASALPFVVAGWPAATDKGSEAADTYMFLGEEGSMGYSQWHTYLIYPAVEGRQITVYCPGHLPCPYDSVASFLDNWRRIRMEEEGGE